MGHISRALTPRAVRRAKHPVHAAWRASERTRKASNRKASAARNRARAQKRAAAAAAPPAPPVVLTERQMHRNNVLVGWIGAFIVAVFIVLCIVFSVVGALILVAIATFLILRAMGVGE
jgi:hypothetical protein